MFSDGLVYSNPLNAIDASTALGARLDADRFEVVGAQEMARLSAEFCNNGGA